MTHKSTVDSHYFSRWNMGKLPQCHRDLLHHDLKASLAMDKNRRNMLEKGLLIAFDGILMRGCQDFYVFFFLWDVAVISVVDNQTPSFLPHHLIIVRAIMFQKTQREANRIACSTADHRFPAL